MVSGIGTTEQHVAVEMADLRTGGGASKLKEHIPNPNPNPNRREKIGGLLSHIAKFAIDSTINLSFKAIPGRKQAHDILQEGIKVQPPSICRNDKKKPEDLKLVMEDMQENMNIVKLQHQISAKHVVGSEDRKKMAEGGIQRSDVLENNEKKIFIRSRL